MLVQTDVNLANDTHGDVHIAMSGVRLSGLYAMAREALEVFVTTADTCTSETRSCLLGPKICSIMKGPIMRFNNPIDRNDDRACWAFQTSTVL